MALLEKVQGIWEAEADQDSQVSDRMDCWCHKQLEGKRRYAEDLQHQLDGLTHEIEAKAAENTRLRTELEQHRSEFTEGKESLSKASALRERGTSKLSEERSLTKRYIDQLDKALQSLQSRHGHELSLVRRMLDSGDASKRKSLLELRRKLEAAASPQMVYGVLKEMRSTFAANLKDMQEDEALMKSRHDDLMHAKAQEIKYIKKQVEAKQQRIAAMSLEVARQRKVMERTGQLLDATVQLVASMERLCEDGDRALRLRGGQRQAGLVALASARAELTGAQLLATSAGGGGAAAGPEDLCALAAGLERPWRGQAEAACAAAKAGHVQDAAEAVEALEDDIQVAFQAASSEAEQCEHAHRDASAEDAAVAKDAEVRATAIGSSKERADSQIEEVEGQAAACQKAKAELLDLRLAQKELLQGTRADAGRIATIVRSAAAAVPPAASAKLHKLTNSADELAEAAAAFNSSNEKGVQELSRLFDAAMQAASKVLIPLRLISADAEEAAVSVHEEQERTSRRASESLACDAVSLAAKAQKLQNHIKKLESASVALAWNSLH